MCEFNPNTRIDPCLRKLIKNLKTYTKLNTVACCCGKYPMTILVKFDNEIFDLVSGVVIPRIRKFYKRDKQGRYHIPEVKNAQREKNQIN